MHISLHILGTYLHHWVVGGQTFLQKIGTYSCFYYHRWCMSTVFFFPFPEDEAIWLAHHQYFWNMERSTTQIPKCVPPQNRSILCHTSLCHSTPTPPPFTNIHESWNIAKQCEIQKERYYWECMGEHIGGTFWNLMWTSCELDRSTVGTEKKTLKILLDWGT